VKLVLFSDFIVVVLFSAFNLQDEASYFIDFLSSFPLIKFIDSKSEVYCLALVVNVKFLVIALHCHVLILFFSGLINRMIPTTIAVLLYLLTLVYHQNVIGLNQSFVVQSLNALQYIRHYRLSCLIPLTNLNLQNQFILQLLNFQVIPVVLMPYIMNFRL
jgi:hypothetical protein